MLGPRGERNREAGGEVEAEGRGRGVMNEGGRGHRGGKGVTDDEKFIHLLNCYCYRE